MQFVKAIKLLIFFYYAIGIAVFLILVASIAYSLQVYNYLTEGAGSFSIGAFEQNDELGYSLRKNASAYYVFATKDSVPIFSNNDRRRCKKQNDSVPVRAAISFIGDSYTFGDGCPAEKTFPFLIGDSLGLTIVNCGVSGYGYAQYLIQLPQILELYKPKVVAIQLSPWLTARSKQPYLPSFLRIPVPFFTVGEDGKIRVNRPLYKTRMFEKVSSKRFAEAVSEPRSILNFLNFYFSIGLPVFIDSYYNYIKSYHQLDRSAEPEDENSVYNYLFESVRNAVIGKVDYVIYYNVGFDKKEFGDLINKGRIMGKDKVLFWDIETQLRSSLTDKSEEAYYKEFGHWGFKPEVLIDRHYNSKAHYRAYQSFTYRNQIDAKK